MLKQDLKTALVDEHTVGTMTGRRRNLSQNIGIPSYRRGGNLYFEKRCEFRALISFSAQLICADPEISSDWSPEIGMFIPPVKSHRGRTDIVTTVENFIVAETRIGAARPNGMRERGSRCNGCDCLEMWKICRPVNRRIGTYR